MKKFISKIVLSAIVILSYPGKIFSSPPQIPIEPLGGEAPQPEEIILTIVDRFLGWVFLPLGALAVVFYSIYFLLKKRKKIKKVYLNMAIICTVLLILAFLLKIVISFIA